MNRLHSLLLPGAAAALALALAFEPGPSLAATNDPVVVRDMGTQVQLSNGRVSITIGKTDATIRTMTLGDSPNLAGRGAYFAVANSGGRDGWDVHNAEDRQVRQTPDLAELSFGAQIGGMHFTQHYILRRGDQGFYVFVLAERRPGDPPERIGQIRWSFYLNERLFDYQLAGGTGQGPIPELRGARTIQDATFRLADGTVYTKYNYCEYLENDWVHGLCGSGPKSFGAFIITPSTEFLQAPSKQELTVHSGPIMHRFLASGHFEPREMSSPAIPEGWTKACGPWLVYLNSGDSPPAMWADAKAQAEKEKAQWPYQWMRHPAYPLQRGEVSGALSLYDGTQATSNALMVLTAPEPDWQLQVLDYIFSTDQAYAGEGVLTLGIAGQTRDPRLQVLVNGEPVGAYAGGNSSALYRSAILAGRYAAAMALAQMIFKERDPVFAVRCLQAGVEVYAMGRAHPGVQQGNSYSAPYRYAASATGCWAVIPGASRCSPASPRGAFIRVIRT